MRLIKSFLFIFLFPGLCFASPELRLDVTNNTPFPINFKEVGWFQYDVRVPSYKKASLNIEKAPGLVTFSMAAFDNGNTDHIIKIISVDRNCEIIGLPAYYGEQNPWMMIYGLPMLYSAGQVDITLEEAADSSPLFSHIVCKVNNN